MTSGSCQHVSEQKLPVAFELLEMMTHCSTVSHPCRSNREHCRQEQERSLWRTREQANMHSCAAKLGGAWYLQLSDIFLALLLGMLQLIASLCQVCLHTEAMQL